MNDLFVWISPVADAPMLKSLPATKYSFDPNTTATFNVYGPDTVVQLGGGAYEVFHDQIGVQTDTFSGSFFVDTSTNSIIPQPAAITITGNGPDASAIPYNILPSQSAGVTLTQANITDSTSAVAGDLFIIVEFQSLLTGTNSSTLRVAVETVTDAPDFNLTQVVTGGVSLAPAGVSQVPEPSSLLALATGAGALLLTRRSAKRSGR